MILSFTRGFRRAHHSPLSGLPQPSRPIEPPQTALSFHVHSLTFTYVHLFLSAPATRHQRLMALQKPMTASYRAVKGGYGRSMPPSGALKIPGTPGQARPKVNPDIPKHSEPNRSNPNQKNFRPSLTLTPPADMDHTLLPTWQQNLKQKQNENSTLHGSLCPARRRCFLCHRSRHPVLWRRCPCCGQLRSKIR